MASISYSTTVTQQPVEEVLNGQKQSWLEGGEFKSKLLEKGGSLTERCFVNGYPELATFGCH